MAATYAVSAPTAAAVKEAAKSLGIGAYGLISGSSLCNLTWAGNKEAVLTKVTGSGTYTTGGDNLAASLFGLKEIHAILPLAVDTASPRGVAPSIVNTASTSTPKLKWYDAAGELTAATSVATYIQHFIVIGV